MATRGFLDRVENPLAPVRSVNTTSHLVLVLEGDEKAAAPGQVVWELVGETFARVVLAVPAGADVVIKNNSKTARTLTAKPAAAPVAATPLPGAKPEPVLAYGMLQRHGVSPDLTISGGVRVLHDASDSRWWTARLRAGVLFYAEPTFISLGIAGQLGALESSSLGFEARLFNLWSGFWGQAGVFPIDSVGGVSLEGAFGYGLFSLDYERRVSGPRSHDQTLCFMVEVPLGLLRVVIKPPDGVVMAPKSTTAAR